MVSGELEKPSGSYPTLGSGHYDLLRMPSRTQLDFGTELPHILVEL